MRQRSAEDEARGWREVEARDGVVVVHDEGGRAAVAFAVDEGVATGIVHRLALVVFAVGVAAGASVVIAR
jgi:hypothetical protein